jgi:predicted SAM-dependent methyltransferase
MEPLRLLNLGCGHIAPKGWINVDGSNRAWLTSKWPWVDCALVALRIIPPTEFSGRTTYADLRRRFPWPDLSIDGIYTGEMLEHFTAEDGEKVLQECYRILKPSGVLRIRVPDNARFWKNYLDEYNAVRQRPRPQWDQNHSRWVQMFFRDICVRKPRPFQSLGHYHKWMYDEVSLILLLEKLGFRDAERMAYHESRLPEVEQVEVREDLIVEAVK